MAKIEELDAELIASDSDVSSHPVTTIAEADGVIFICPKCGQHSVLCWFKGRVAADREPGPGRWTPTGTGLADLTLEPSIDLSSGVGCGWHGFVTNGRAGND